ncbi:malto-oligosyltrehalose synthase [Spelaeicoccus albus]|uniref:(1->4)-alpha-D-glucan 1-alpha-D-glucosylmutase n=1 Tax=Spelaeicoccus albus TaxID=1280376 RepID=A0A7Z0IGY7_9MICO|nr:malto-oligosyltrehalose synthase [Spelaeicoccus albus]NYI67430.1 (1->4)-alpha-D-glucan 1-alpha-D-glucosylmutase [Spelaeicoccus albus]
MRTPVSTYRLQVRESFDFDAAAAVLDYVRGLGADWVYLSPVLQAEPGSSHGYDVVRHDTVDVERGGREGLRRLADAAHGLGLGVLIDIVPNHMGVATPAVNVWWWDLLTHGRGSRYAEAFDVDWDAAGGKIRIPVLGDDSDPGSELGKLRIDESGAEPVLCYYDNRYPISPGTLTDREGAPDDAHAAGSAVAVHARQHYELVNWRRADDELNYRRFFAVNTLAGVRVEEPWVLGESHSQIGSWFGRGRDGAGPDGAGPADDSSLADGLRVDHPDGLADPKGYLESLRTITRDAYTVVEKILEPGERLPGDWACEGTTGYDALGDIDRVLIDPAGKPGLDRLDAELRGTKSGKPVDWHDLTHDTKRAVADGILRSEVLRLTRLIDRPRGDAADALAELMANFPVYRSYLPAGSEHLDAAVAESTRRRPDLAGSLDRLLPLLSDPMSPLARRFQQTSGMVMAKGVEDCAFYRYSRLTSLTEVGGDPSVFSIEPAEFHSRQELRLSRSPRSMTTLSTHDTKRSENVRARIDVLSEIPGEWTELVRAVRPETALDDGPLANLLLQAVVGSWPATPDRLHAYAEKAAREAGDSTTWTAPDAAFEQSMHDFVDYCLGSAAVKSFADRIAAPAASNILTAKLLQLAAPGVPDVYQGSEFGDENSLVDPDNRRPVDFDARRAALARLDAGELADVTDPAAKLLVTSRSLRLRRDRPDLFGGYRAVHAAGRRASHLLGFDRGGAVALGTRLPAGLAASGGWADTVVDLGGGYVDVFTRRRRTGTVPVADLFADYPVALLRPAEEDDQ